LARKYYDKLFHFFLVGMIYTFWFIYSYKSIVNWYSFLQLFSFSGVCVLVTYVEMYVLFKKFFLKGKVLTYVVTSFFLFLIGGMLLQRIYETSWSSFFHAMVKTDFIIEVFVLMILCIAFSGFGITYLLFRMWLESERKISDLANANLKAELENLKKQISPHFLFNTLNNLYVLAKTKPAQAADAILELADLLKYQLYECSSERVSLKKEMEYISSLLALEKLRKDKWTININFPRKVPETFHIEPLIFITLIENAIKHGSQKLHSGSIDVRLLLENDRLFFEIINSKPAKATPGPVHPSIGLNNLKRRLELLYPDQHQLVLSDNIDSFTAALTLDL